MRARLAVLTLLIALALPACRTFEAPPSVTTPAGKAAWSADQAVKALGDLQTVVIALNQAGQLSDKTAIPIEQFVSGASKTIAELPQGWQAMLIDGWARAKAVIPTTNPKMAAAVTTIDVLITALQGGQ